MVADRIKTAVVGVGNCFAGLYQGIEYYKRNPNIDVVGVAYQEIGPYKVTDIDFVAGFDVSTKKIGKTLDKATFEHPNMVNWIELPPTEAKVYPSPVLDGVGKWVKEDFSPHNIEKDIKEWKEECISVLKETGTEVLINFLPVGSEEAARFWAEVCIEADVAFINAMPTFIVSDPEWEKKFRDKNIPAIGDDIKAQIGATVLNRTLASLLVNRGCKVNTNYQLNFGGNTDFKNMIERERLKSKKVSKTEAVQSALSHMRLDNENIHIGPSDYVPFLKNTKICYLNIKGTQWADIPFEIEVKLTVDDKANAGAIAADCIRFAKLALDMGIGGDLKPVSSFYSKHPAIQMDELKAMEEIEKTFGVKREA